MLVHVASMMAVYGMGCCSRAGCYVHKLGPTWRIIPHFVDCLFKELQAINNYRLTLLRGLTKNVHNLRFAVVLWLETSETKPFEMTKKLVVMFIPSSNILKSPDTNWLPPR